MIRLALAVLSLGLAAGAAQAQTQKPSDELEGMLRALAMIGGLGASEEEAAAIAAAAAVHPLGSRLNPVRANMPEGQRAYLQRLRCANGRAPSFRRIGSDGESIYGNILDLYEVNCRRAEPGRVDVFIDMYHLHVEEAPVPGFTIVAPR